MATQSNKFHGGEANSRILTPNLDWESEHIQGGFLEESMPQEDMDFLTPAEAEDSPGGEDK